MSAADPATDAVTVYRADPDTPGSLSSNDTYSLYEDRAGSLWVGTWGGGLNRFDRRRRLHPYRHDAYDPDSLSSDRVTVLAEDRRRPVDRHVRGWPEPASIGAQALHHGTRTDLPNPESLSFTTSRVDLCTDRSGLLGSAPQGGGLNLVSAPIASRFPVYRHDPQDPNSLSSDTVRAVVEDRSGSLWVGT